MAEAAAALQDLVERGGPVLAAILGVTFVLWLLLLERALFVGIGSRREVERIVREWREWQRRCDWPERGPWHARQVRRMLVSELRVELERTLPLIRALVAVCPLLGLLGTVSGMVEVFDAVGRGGGAHARVMAAGISRATIPTMAGMVAALSGYLPSAEIARRARARARSLADRLEPAGVGAGGTGPGPRPDASPDPGDAAAGA